ncbi:MAG: peptidase S8 [Chloroflexi bacterium]|nr:MAG: peptidase S8 [Chloroflexota bacterium]
MGTPYPSAITSIKTPGLDTLWAETLGDPGICIAILDGPVDQSHTSLAAANLTQVETLVAGITSQGSATFHGTHVASVIFGQHDGPVKGIAPQSCGLIVPIFQDGPKGSIAPCSQVDLARAITQAVQAGAHVINISGGEKSLSGAAHPILTDAIQMCSDNDVLIVAAAGNEGCECLHIPGASPSVLAVGAMDAQNQPLPFSNWGDEYRSQGVLALGEEILGAVPGGGTARQSGTSYATPIVSGVVALLLSLQKKLGLEMSPQAIRDAILSSANACDWQNGADCRPFLVGSLNVSGAQALIVQKNKEMNVARYQKGGDEITTQKKQSSLSTEMKSLTVGDVAPEFVVQDHQGQEVRLSDYRGQLVVLWFYPHADTPG